MTCRTLTVWLVIAGSVLSFSAFALLAAPGKTIPSDEVNPRLETVLQELSRTAQAQPLAVQQFAKDKGISVADDLITVIVEPVSGRVSTIDRAAVVAIGGEVEATSKSLMRVRVPISQLEAMADQVSGIAFIRLPYRPRPLVVTSEGVGLTGADDFHSVGYYGQGVKVAIIDLGFDGLAGAQATGELQNVAYTWDYIGNDSNVEGTGEVHGTAVAEIVADMAPQAELYLLLIGDSVDLANATQYCITNGINIINHSVGWYNTNFYDGTGTVAGIANNARDNNILWVNAAGNEASDGHWQGFFTDGDGDRLHEFSGSDEGNRIYIPSTDSIYVYLTWDGWPTSDQDYDLYLYNSNGDLVASATNWQSGTQAPTEALHYTPADDATYLYTDGYYDIAIYKYAASGSIEMEFFTFRGSGLDPSLEYHVPESSIVTPANSAKVLTVGAINHDYWTTGPQESFSSQGPSNTSTYAVSITKPDICGPDGVSSYTYGSFLGTSAASPHVAGAAALLLSEDPTLTADQLQAKLEGDAINMGAAGKDNLYGSGRLNLVPAPTGNTAAVFRVDKSGNVYADSAYYGAGFYTGSADVAEWVAVSEPVEPGDVLELDPDNPGQYRKSLGPCSDLVAGVVSTAPGFVLGSPPTTTDHSLRTTNERALLALVGIVPIKVTDEGGPINPGDLLVSSSIPGYAMRWDLESGEPCSLIGKALESMEEKHGIVLALLTVH